MAKQKMTKQEKEKRQAELKNEDANTKFIRVATPRIKRIVKDMRLLGNMAKQQVYDFSEDNRKNIFGILDTEMANLHLKFEQKNEKSKDINVKL